jgi:anti-sigma regulatory factor (Ser/Thr protein kinase)
MECLLVARHVRAAFEPSPVAPREMRQVVRAVLADTPPERVYDVELAVSELVANSVEHAHTHGSVAITLQCNGAVLVEASDEDAGWGPPPAPDHPGGRGLGIVDRLADRWDVRWTATGKTVWAWFGVLPSEVPRPLVTV